jgi:hypothetical protein
MTVTPTPEAPSLLPGEDTGASDSDGVIDLSGPMLVGQTLPYAVITLYDNGIATTVANGTADANGFYSIYPYPVLDDGKHTLTITSTAPGDAPSLYSAPLYIVVDTAKPDPPTAPQLAAGFDTGISAEDGITNKNVIQLTGTAEPGSTVTLYDVDKDNKAKGPALATATAAANGTYTLTTGALADAAYSFDVTATDLAGNVSMASASTSITIDTTPPPAPSAPILSPGTDTGVSRSDGLTDNDTPIVTGTTEANATVELFDGVTMVGKATADGSGNYAITTDKLAEGPHALTVKAVDAAGNVSAASQALNVVIDDTAPTGTSTPETDQAIFGSIPFTLQFNEPVSGLTLQDLTLTTTGTATGEIAAITGSGSDYTVTVDGLSGAGTLALSLKPGGAVTDEAGNVAQLTASDSYAYSDQDAPAAFIVGTFPFEGSDGAIATSFSGRLIAFDSTAAQTPGETVSGQDLFLRDLRTGGLTQITADGVSGLPALSSSGTTLVFVSTADDLVANGPTDGAPNVYVAHLSTSNVPDGQAVTVSSIQLVSEGNGQDGVESTLGAYDAPAVSADGTHVAFVSSKALIAGVTPGYDNVYEEDLTTGDLTLISSTPGGTGGNANSDTPSLSGDGSKVAFESEATDLTDTPTPQYTEQSYVYDNTTNTLTLLNGAQALGFTPVPGFDGPESYAPHINTLGNWVTYSIQLTTSSGAYNRVAFVVNQNIVNGKLEQLTPSTLGNYDDGSYVSYGGRYVSYIGNDLGYNSAEPAYEVVVDDAVTGTGTTIASGYNPVLSPDGNAVAFVSPLYSAPDGNGTITQEGGDIVVETLGPTVGINPVDGDDEIDASAWKQALASGLVVTGMTDAPDGSNVQLQLINITTGATISTLQGIVVTGGKWTGTLAAADLSGLADGSYQLNAVASATNGSSFPSNRLVTLDTVAPTQPGAPKLDAGSDTSTAHDGSATNRDAPTLTGSAEAGATVTLYDTSGTSPTSPIGTAVADSAGVYAITPSVVLADGKHTLDVTATDAAGNVSDASDGLTFTVDTKAPETPDAPMLAPAPGTDDQFPGTSFGDGSDGAAATGSDTGESATDGITDNASPTLVGLAEPNTTVTLYDTDGVAVLGTATVGANGKYAISSSLLSDGMHQLTVTDTDAAGNVSHASAPLPVTIDTLPPLQPIITSVTGPLVSGKITAVVTVNGTAEPGSKVQLVLDGGMTAASIFGEATAASDGDYSINSDPLPAGDGQNLSVTATDVAGNTSQPSLPVDVNITDTATPPPGVPPFTPTLLGLLTDGPISGATVFADTNGNGMRDADEGSAITDANGDFQLIDTGGELIATGGTDSATGLANLVALVAPAGSEDIDPLTTLLAIYQQKTGASLAAAQAAVTAALGVAGGGGTDLTKLDPIAAAVSGSAALDPAVAHGAPLSASAKIMDTAIDFANVLVGDVLAGTHPGTTAIDALIKQYFAGVIGAMATVIQQTGTLDLDNQATLNVILTEAASNPAITSAFAAQAANQPTAVAIVAAENSNLDALAAGATLPTAVAQVEYVAQGAAAAALQALPNDTQATIADVQTEYTGQALYTATSAALALLDGAPRFLPASDTGESDQDNTTTDVTPTFIGTTKPGTYVTIFEDKTSYPPNSFYPVTSTVVIGTGIADALGHYSIAVTSLTADTLAAFPTVVGAVASATDPDVAAGDIIAVPADAPTLTVFFDDTDANAPFIEAATPAAVAGDDAGHSALLVYGMAAADQGTGASLFGVIQVYADGGTTPIGTGLLNGDFAFAITTTSLSIGQHTLTVTETLSGGTVLTGSPFTVTVGAATFVDGTASATGAIAGATVYEYDRSPDQSTVETLNITQDAVSSVTTATGAYTDTYYAAGQTALILRGGYDTVTGVPLGGYVAQTANLLDSFPATLMAPYDFATVTPLSTLLDWADADDQIAGGATPADNDGNEAGVLSAFGLPTDLDLATLNPLASAQAGDTAPLLVTAKLLDTVTILSGLVGFNFVPIADYIQNFSTIDLDSASDIAAAYGAFLADSPAYNQSYENGAALTADLPAVAAIVAASNQAIDSHAASASSVADLLSYTLAAETFAQETETAAVAVGVAADPGDGSSLAALTPSYTGAALDAAIEAARGQATQATNFVAAGPAMTASPSVTFTITLSQSVSGLSDGDFSIVAGGDLTDVAVTGVTAVAGSDGTAYDVSVSTGIGQGTLALTFNGTGLTSGVGKPITDALFAPAVTTLSPTGIIGGAIAVGDFNGDGRPDAVLSGTGQYGLTLFLNNGNGSFTAQAPITGGLNGYDIVVGDFNGDGKLDVAEIGSADTSGDSTLAILLGNGDGTFQSAIDSQVAPGALAVGDFNRDGHLDLAITDFNTDTVSILLGNGDGSFTAGQSFTTASPTAEIETADLNSDGKLDLVMASTGAGTVSIFLGNGDGTFTAAPNETIQVGSDPQGIAIGDLNGDGIPDIVVANSGSDSVSVLLGKGDGTFTALAPFVLSQAGIDTSFLANFQPSSIAIADLNSDDKPDLVLTSPRLGTVVLDGNGEGTFTLGDQTADGPTGNDVGAALALADVDGDGRTDILEPGDVAQSGIAVATVGLNVMQNEAPPVLGSTSPSITIDRSAVADPMLTKTSGGGTLAQDGDAYTLDLGTLTQDDAAAAVLALVNAASAPADSFDGVFSTRSGNGFVLTGATLAAAIAAGQSQGGITFTADTSTPGIHSETITFAPRDTTATPAQVTVPDGDGGTVVAASVADPDAVAAELPALTLTITDDVVPGGALPPAALGAVASPVVLPNVRIGGIDTQAISITNSAASGSADLDVTATASGEATVSGSITGLAPQATDDSSLLAGIDTSAAGAQSGMVALAPVSEPDTGLATDNVAVSGNVYREATAFIAPVNVTVHVGDPGSTALQITNSTAPDGFSEALIAAITGVTTGLSIAAAGPTADIAAGATDPSSLAVGFSTAAAGTITGTATLGLSSDGGTGAGSIDGLGQAALPSATVPITVTVDNYAQAGFSADGGTLTAGTTPGTWLLNLGTVAQGGAALAADLSVLNAAQGPADVLGGSFTVSGGGAFTNTGFGAFSGVGADGSADAGSVSLATSKTGTFSETLLLTPTDTEGAGTPTTQAPQTVIVTGMIAAPTGIAQGDVHMVTFDGLHYDFQATGDFVLARSTQAGNSFEIQMRAEPWQSNPHTSVATEIAAQVGDDVVSFGVGGAATTVSVNGIADTAIGSGGAQRLLEGGHIQALSSTSYVLTWDTGETLAVTQPGDYLSISATLGPQDGPGSVQGLLGGDTGQANDFALPDGTVLTQPLSTSTLLGTFADAWTVAPGLSLLDGAVPAASGLGTPLAMTFLSATAPGQILIGSLQAGGQTSGPVTMMGALADFSGDTVTNLAAQDLIDVIDVGSALATIAYKDTGTGGVLTIGDGSASATLHLAGHLSSSAFHEMADQHGGTLIGYV